MFSLKPVSLSTALLSIASLAVPCAAEPPRFTDVTEPALAGSSFLHAGASLDLFPFAPVPGDPAPLGWLGGVVVADLNGDGWNDLFVTNGRGGSNHLFLNRATPELSFAEVGVEAGVAFPGDETAAAVAGDLDGDGDLDLYVSVVGLAFGPPPVVQAGPNRLLLNQGNDADGVPVFVDVAADVGATGDPFTRSQLPSLVDFDRDGDLDVFVAAHNPIVNPGFDSDSPDYPGKRPPSQTGLLLRNLLAETGELAFEDATVLLRNELSGTLGDDGRPIFDSRFTFDGAWFDVDGDGWPDLVQANDLGEIGLFVNVGGEAFRYASPEAGLVDVGAWMSLTPGDLDGDGDLDFFASNVGLSTNIPTFTNRAHALYANDGSGFFADIAGITGVANPIQDGDASGDFGWGGQFLDYDNDGDLDLFFLGNWFGQGFGIDDAVGTDGEPLGPGLLGHTNHAHLFENLGTDPATGLPDLVDRLSTVEQRAAAGLDNPEDGRSVVAADLDNDGDADLVIGNMSGRATAGRPGGFADRGPYEGGLRILRNDATGHRALKVRLVGTESNRFGVGARVEVVSRVGRQVREVRAGDGHLAAGPPEALFGVGDARAAVVFVRWPSGRHQVVGPLSLQGEVTTIEVLEGERPGTGN